MKSLGDPRGDDFADEFWEAPHAARPASKLGLLDQGLRETAAETASRIEQLERWSEQLADREAQVAADEVRLDELLDGQIGEVYQRLKAQEGARRQLAAEDRASHPVPEPLRLTDLLAEPDTPVDYRIDQLWPTGGRVILSAPMKSGKTTLVGNLVRSLADGAPFLDNFAVQQAQDLVVIDDEMDRNQIRRWLRDQRVINAARVRIVPLRGRVGTLDLLDPGRRAEWAALIRGADVLVLDCLRPVLDALGLSEDKDAGKFLVAFDALLDEAGVREGLIVHHTGHQGERSRGDSRLRDWPDAEWKIIRSTDDDTKPRFFSAFGRDVDVREGRLEFNAALRRLTYLEGEDRRSTVDPVLIRAVLEYVRDNPSCNTTELTDSTGSNKGEAQSAVQLCRTSGFLQIEGGPRNAKLHTITPGGEDWLAAHVVGGKLVVQA